MPDESCRNCGMSLRVQNKCSTCMESIQQICYECRYATLERIHTRCASGLETIYYRAAGTNFSSHNNIISNSNIF